MKYKVYNEIFHTHFTGFSCLLAPTSQLCRLCVCLWQCVLHLVPRVSVCLSVRPAAHKQSALVCWFLRVHDCERSCVNRVQRMDVAKMSGWHEEGLLMFFPLPGNFPPVLQNSVSPRGKRGFQVGAKCCWQRSWKSRAVTGFLLISLSCVSCFFRSLCIFLNPLFCRNLRYKKSADTHGYTSTFFARRWPRHLPTVLWRVYTGHTWCCIFLLNFLFHSFPAVSEVSLWAWVAAVVAGGPACLLHQLEKHRTKLYLFAVCPSFLLLTSCVD